MNEKIFSGFSDEFYINSAVLFCGPFLGQVLVSVLGAFRSLEVLLLNEYVDAFL